MHPAATDIDVLLRDCDIRRQRRGGPGGQHRNKVETAVIITHNPTGIQAEANERRSQEQNRQVAIFRLRVHLAISVRDQISDLYEPSELWRSRRSTARLVISPTHKDFPALLSEALDVLAAHGMDVKPAAEQLGVSASQLVKLLRAERQALIHVNTLRAKDALPPLR